MKRSIIVGLSMILIGIIIFSGCSGVAKKSGQDDSLDRIKKAGKIVVGLDDSFPPMGFRDEKGNIVGFDIDMAKEAAKRMGVKAEFKPIDWDSKMLDLNSKNIDVIWNGLTITEQRKKEMGFTKPYIADKQILVVVKGSPIKTKADLAGKKIGLQAGSSSYDAFEKDQKTFKSIKEIVQYSNNNEALMDLKIGRTDAVIVDEVVGRYYIAKKPDDYVVLDDHFGEEEFGVGLRLEDKAFLEALQKALDDMKKDGTSAKISNQWFGEDIIK